MKLVLALFLLISVVSSLKFDSDGSCSSEEHHHGGGGRPRPNPPRPRPNPPRPRRCAAGWLSFNRPQGVWCVKVGYLPGNHQNAENYCRSQGATLTGYQTAQERMAVANEGLKVLRSIGQPIGTIWIGATSVSGCHVRSCGPLATFIWTDGHTTGTAGFKWGGNEPDNMNWGSPSCIQQFIMTPEYWSNPTWTNFQLGDLDKYNCGDPAWPNTKLYACGKSA